jgi:hypothetical protein
VKANDARRLLLVLSLLCLALLLPARAEAFFTRGFFERSAALGGAGSLFYTGSVRERGWDCSACHVDAPRKLRVGFTVQPSDFVASRSYVPDTEYTIEVALLNEALGLGTQFNSNGFLAEFSQGRLPMGRLAESSTTELLDNGRIVSSLNVTRDLYSWSFRWTAPAPGSGPVVINLGAVDGNGAGEASLSFQDYQNDDIYVAELELTEASAATGANRPRERRFLASASRPGVGERVWFWAAVLLLVGGTSRFLGRPLVRRTLTSC